MTELNTRESELVALGAALASNCVPCIERILPRARNAGLTDEEIEAAIRLADSVRQVPARAVLQAARNLLHGTAGAEGTAAGCEPPAGMAGKCAPFAQGMSQAMAACRHGCS